MRPLPAARGGICFVAGVHVDPRFVGLRQAWCVAVFVGSIANFTRGGELRSRRLRKLPDEGVLDSAFGRIGSFGDAAGRRWALVVEDPLLYFGKALCYLFCRGDAAFAIRDIDARAIDAGTQPGSDYGSKPGAQICRLLG